jgi:hypothetical protein
VCTNGEAVKMVEGVDTLVDVTNGGLAPVPARNRVTLQSILSVQQSAKFCCNPSERVYLVLNSTGLNLTLLELDVGMPLLELSQDFLS